MNVETFECAETAAEPIEATEEAVGLIEQLGLAGQKEMMRPKTAEVPAARWPYREITAEEVFVYQTLCPESTKIEAYAGGPIPLRVLQIAAHAKSVKPTTRLMVWHRALPGVKDPVLVAEFGRYDWSTDNRYILARWGDELETFAVLMKRAAEAARERLISEVETLLAQVKACAFSDIIKAGPNIQFKWQQ